MEETLERNILDKLVMLQMKLESHDSDIEFLKKEVNNLFRFFLKVKKLNDLKT